MAQTPSILIIGGGPVGLSLACALTQAGIETHVFEKDTELNNEIRASTFHPWTLEQFDKWGIADQIIEKGYKVGSLQYWERSTKELIAEFNYDGISGDTDYPYRLQCPQHIATRVLKPFVESSPFGHVHMGHELISFEDNGSSVIAKFNTVEGEKVYEGNYLCGADGASSTVRKQLALGFDGMTYEDRFLLFGTDIDISQEYPQAGPVCYMFDPKEWVIILNLPDIVRVVFKMKPDEIEEEALKPDAIKSRIDGFVGKGSEYNVMLHQVYRVHQRVVDSLRVNRVLLLGDAAHINNPAGGMGMNSGIQDAANLADKLSKVLNGGAENLLDQYATERWHAAKNSIQTYTDKRYNDMAMKSETDRLARNEDLQESATDAAKSRAYLLQASMLANRI